MSKAHAGMLDAEEQLHNLRVFVSVADAESITRAAEQLFKAPSVITRSILDLEHFVGKSLFERKPRGMLLNAYGEAVLVRARRIHDETRIAVDEFLKAPSSGAVSSRSAINNLLFNGRKLRLLVCLAASGSISTAAAMMKLTRTGASMALSRIEAGLGQPLFKRVMQGMVATEAAERLVLHAKRIFAEMRHMHSDVSSVSGDLVGSVVIGTLPLGRTYVMPRAISSAISRYPGLRVTTIDSNYDQLIEGLRAGDIDIVFGVLRPSDLCHGLLTERLFDDRLGVVVRAGHPLTERSQLALADISNERWITPRANAPGRLLVDESFRQQGVEPPVPSVETGDLAIMRQLLIDSDMLAATSLHQMMFEIRSGTLAELPVSLGNVIRHVGIILREGGVPSPATRAVLDAFRAEVQNMKVQEKVPARETAIQQLLAGRPPLPQPIPVT